MLTDLRVDKESSHSVTLIADLSKVDMKLSGFRVKIVRVEDNESGKMKTMYFLPGMLCNIGIINYDIMNLNYSFSKY